LFASGKGLRSVELVTGVRGLCYEELIRKFTFMLFYFQIVVTVMAFKTIGVQRAQV
jgi:hypothetical protein